MASAKLLLLLLLPLPLMAVAAPTPTDPMHQDPDTRTQLRYLVFGLRTSRHGSVSRALLCLVFTFESQRVGAECHGHCWRHSCCFSSVPLVPTVAKMAQLLRNTLRLREQQQQQPQPQRQEIARERTNSAAAAIV